MEKKFGNYTYFEVAQECAKYTLCTHCPFFDVCYFSDAAIEKPSLKKDRGIYNKIIKTEV